MTGVWEKHLKPTLAVWAGPALLLVLIGGCGASSSGGSQPSTVESDTGLAPTGVHAVTDWTASPGEGVRGGVIFRLVEVEGVCYVESQGAYSVGLLTSAVVYSGGAVAYNPCKEDRG